MFSETHQRIEIQRSPDEAVHAPGEWVLEHALSAVLICFVSLVVAGGFAASSISVGRSVRAAGVLEQPAVWTVRSREAGIVGHVLVHTGQAVSRGEPLVRMDDVELTNLARTTRLTLEEAAESEKRLRQLRPYDLATAQERVRSAASGAQSARLRLAMSLVENGFAPNVDSALAAPASRIHVAVDLAREAALQAAAESRIAQISAERAARDTGDLRREALAVQRARGELTTLSRRRAWTALVSPLDGVVLTDGVDRLAGRAVRAGESVIEIAANDGWTARLLVSEHDVAAVKPGQRVELEIRTAGRVTSVRAEGAVESISPQPWSPLEEGGVGPLMASPRSGSAFLVIVRLRPDSSGIVDAVARRGRTVSARIETGRGRLGAVLLERVLGVAGAQ